MNTTQIPFLVEGILILVCAIFGVLLGRTGKPYGKVKLAIHLFLYVWLTVGFAFIFAGAIKVMMLTWPVALMGLMILTLLVTGIMMMASRKAGKTLPMIHTLATILMVLSVITAFIFTGLR